MSSSPILTTPVARAIGLVSCIRFRQRTNVLLPQPDGQSTPSHGGRNAQVDVLQRVVRPYHAFRCSTSMPTPLSLPFQYARAA